MRILAYDPQSWTTFTAKPCRILTTFQIRNRRAVRSSYTRLSFIRRWSIGPRSRLLAVRRDILTSRKGSCSVVCAPASFLWKKNLTKPCAGHIDGSIATLTPVEEEPFKRLLLLQGQLLGKVQHVSGLNPRAFRYVHSDHSLPTLDYSLSIGLCETTENRNHSQKAYLTATC
jgi:hypothetical protein